MAVTRALRSQVVRALRHAVVAVLWVLVACGATAFAFFFIMTLTRWYYADATELIAWRTSLVLDYKIVNATTGKAQPILSSTTSVLILWQWCSTMAMALGAAGLLWLSALPSAYPARPLKAQITTPKADTASNPTTPTISGTTSDCSISTAPSVPAKAPRAAKSIGLKYGRRVWHLIRLQVPPRGLWRRLLGPTGLSVLDLLLFLLWLGLHILWLTEMTQRALASRRMAPPPPKAVVKNLAPSITGLNVSNSSAVTSLTAKSAPQSFAPTASPAAASAQQTAALAGGLRRLLQQQQAQATPSASSPSPIAAAANTKTSAAKTTTTVKPLPQAVQSSIAQWTGLIGNLDLLLLFFPLPRCNFLHWLLGSDFPTLLKYHRWLGHGTILLYSIHGIMYLAFWARDGVMADRMTWNMSGSTNTIAGVISMAGGWLIWLTCIPVIRRRFFNVFYSSHILGAVLLLLFGFMHRKDVMPWVMPGILLYLLDVVLRTIQQSFNSTCVSAVAESGAAATATISENGSVLTLCIKCDKCVRWCGSDIVFLNVPAISWWQWHPFTLASSSSASSPADAGVKASNGGLGSSPVEVTDTNKMVLHIKTYSHWTQRLIARLAVDPTAPLKMYVSGPYQSANRQWLSGFDHHVFVAGGIGATPTFGMLLELLHRRRAASGDAATRATVIWITRNEDELATIPAELLQEAARTDSGAWLGLQLYLTGTPAVREASLSCKHSSSPTAQDSSAGQDAAPKDGSTSCPRAACGPPAATGPAPSLTSDGVVLRIPFHRAKVVAGNTDPAAAQQHASPDAGSSASRLLAHPYMFSPLLWILAMLLCFGGAFAGLICVQAYDARMARTVPVRDDFTHVGMLAFAALGMGAVLPPALLMLAVHIYWEMAVRRSTDRAANSQHAHSSFDLPFHKHSSCADAHRLSSVLHARMSVASTLTCATDDTAWDTANTAAVAKKDVSADAPGANNTADEPTDCAKAAGCAGALPVAGAAAHADVMSFVAYGRPDLEQLLLRVAACCPDGDPVTTSVTAGNSADGDSSAEEQHVAVFVAGPVGLVERVEEICARVNGVWGRRDRAYLLLKPLTHEF